MPSEAWRREIRSPAKQRDQIRHCSSTHRTAEQDVGPNRRVLASEHLGFRDPPLPDFTSSRGSTSKSSHCIWENGRPCKGTLRAGVVKVIVHAPRGLPPGELDLQPGNELLVCTTAAFHREGGTPGPPAFIDFRQPAPKRYSAGHHPEPSTYASYQRALPPPDARRLVKGESLHFLLVGQSAPHKHQMEIKEAHTTCAMNRP